MTDLSLSRGPDETALPEPEPAVAEDLERALAAPVGERRAALSAVAAAHPNLLEAWARLSEQSSDPVEAYAYARVGYHRGLDQLRGAGWHGTGYVRWSQPTNRGFLRSLEALRAAATVIGEQDEAERCSRFLRQLDPSWEGLPEDD